MSDKTSCDWCGNYVPRDGGIDVRIPYVDRRGLISHEHLKVCGLKCKKDLLKAREHQIDAANKYKESEEYKAARKKDEERRARANEEWEREKKKSRLRWLIKTIVFGLAHIVEFIVNGYLILCVFAGEFNFWQGSFFFIYSIVFLITSFHEGNCDPDVDKNIQSWLHFVVYSVIGYGGLIALSFL